MALSYIYGLEAPLREWLFDGCTQLTDMIPPLSSLVPSCLLLAGGGTTTADVSAFIAWEKPIALRAVLANIGPSGGAGAGLVIASPSKQDPDYFYTWTRDAALTVQMVVDEIALGKSALESYVDDYVRAQAILQTVANPSGRLLPSGNGLGEPKFEADGTRFNGNWGRPQRDGPALRAVTLMQYSTWLMSQGRSDKVRTILWPIIANDLSYVGQYWNSTGFDLWEEVSGSSFFTTQVQYRALAQGAALAQQLGGNISCKACHQAGQVLCFLQSYWNGQHQVANVHTNSGRTGVDTSTILGAIAVFDVAAGCRSPTLQPCHSRSLANFKVVVDTFSDPALYPINAGRRRQRAGSGSGVALGRYPEDVYFGGNPWYLTTLAAAEFLYDAIAAWSAQGYVDVDLTSLAFFRDLYPAAQPGRTYRRSGGGDGGGEEGDVFKRILNAAAAYADSFVAIVEEYTPADGALAEQFDRTTGAPLSARDLTWSYASFITMARRRDGQHPLSWSSSWTATTTTTNLRDIPPVDIPPVCTGTSAKGTYAPAVAAGAPDITANCTSTVLFVVNATTYFGENVYLVGNTTDLGAWDVANAPALTAANYTAERPVWFVELALQGGKGNSGGEEVVSYLYARQQDCGQPWIYETTNRTLVVPACSDGGGRLGDDDDTGSSAPLVTTDDAWIGPVGSSGHCS